MPVIADDESVDQSPVVAEEDQTELRQTSVLVPQRDVDAADDAGTVEPAAGVDLAPVPAATPAAAPPALPLQVDTPLPAGLSVEAGVASPAMAPTPSPEPRESPGWRPRRHSAL
jgi:hypothetical protein